jgi:hypothetical protein
MDPWGTLLHKALARGNRSTVLQSLGWLLGICSVSSISAFGFKAPNWLGTMFGIGAGISIALYLIAYVYFGLTDPDLLRSEKYHIQKMAIQKGFVGDDSTGFFRLPSGIKSLPSSQEQKGDK